MSSSSSAEEHGGWKLHTGCKCPFSKKKLTQLWLIETPVTHGIVTLALNILSPLAPHPVFHMAIQCIYRCSQCGDVDYYTFEFSKEGKEARCGEYKNGKCLRSCDRGMTLEELYQIYLSTWPNAKGSDYDTVNHNCQHFAREMWAEI
ncbi:unnamed protein product [Adineta ricciae]|uniref:PPPDE domain-containing protein n=1 Tax=Adineta ricciae TaxID=249248 RepID=A0A813YDV1_ADIRI|nr:unnamed protein product [Adineta ricciae]CAF0959471.1 unnamed protein product [Adineta ricciae]